VNRVAVLAEPPSRTQSVNTQAWPALRPSFASRKASRALGICPHESSVRQAPGQIDPQSCITPELSPAACEASTGCRFWDETDSAAESSQAIAAQHLELGKPETSSVLTDIIL
jgi:hypothetical protein